MPDNIANPSNIAALIGGIMASKNRIKTKLLDLGLAAANDSLYDLSYEIEDIANNGAISATVQEGTSYTIPAGYHNGSGVVAGESGGGNYTLQTKTVTPTKAQQIQYSVNVTPNYTVNDWGTEEFLGTTIAVVAQTLYAQNLRDKLRTDVLTISPQDLTEGQQSQVYTNLNLKSFHLNDTISSFPFVIEDERINTMMSAANVVFGTPSAILSDVEWVTAHESITFTGTLASNMTTTVAFDMAPILSVASADIDTAAVEAEVNSFLNNLESDINDTQAQANAVLDSINDELQALQSDAAVELKKLQFNNVAMGSSTFASNSTYEDYGYRGTLALNNVIANMVPEVTLSVKDATAGTFAPVAETYNGGIYLYSSEMPDEDLTIPTIICWRGNG